MKLRKKLLAMVMAVTMAVSMVATTSAYTNAEMVEDYYIEMSGIAPLSTTNLGPTITLNNYWGIQGVTSRHQGAWESRSTGTVRSLDGFSQIARATSNYRLVFAYVGTYNVTISTTRFATQVDPWERLVPTNQLTPTTLGLVSRVANHRTGAFLENPQTWANMANRHEFAMPDREFTINEAITHFVTISTQSSGFNHWRHPTAVGL